MDNLRYPIGQFHFEREIAAEQRVSLIDRIEQAPALLRAAVVLLESLHRRWVALLRSLKPQEFARTFRHPERGVMGLDEALAMYAWHGDHHIAHITSLRQRMNWNS